MRKTEMNSAHMPSALITPICDSVRELMLATDFIRADELYSAVHKAIPISMPPNEQERVVQDVMVRLMPGLNLLLHYDEELKTSFLEQTFTPDGKLRWLVSRAYLLALLTVEMKNISLSGSAPVMAFSVEEVLALAIRLSCAVSPGSLAGARKPQTLH